MSPLIPVISPIDFFQFSHLYLLSDEIERWALILRAERGLMVKKHIKNRGLMVKKLIKNILVTEPCTIGGLFASKVSNINKCNHLIVYYKLQPCWP